MTEVLADEIERFVRAVGPQPDETLREMDEFAAAEGFPHVGPEVGSALRLLARLVDAERVFEFGSGYGYSAYWFADALPDDGEIVLTEIDEDELDLAREYMAAGGFDDVARYELGEALESVERYDGPFDVVLIDIDKPGYVEAFEAIKPKVPVGGVVVADNAVTAWTVDFDRLLEIVEDQAGGDGRAADTDPDYPDDTDEATAGIAAYLERVTSDPDFETIVLPIGSGIAVSYRLR